MLLNFKKLYSPVFPGRIGETIEIAGKVYETIGYTKGLPIVKDASGVLYRLTSKKGDDYDLEQS